MLYANDFNTWLPIWDDAPSHPRNVIGQLNYTYYIIMSGIPDVRVPQSFTNSITGAGGSYQNMGYLYAGRYLGTGESLFCPAQVGPNNAFSATFYSPLLTTDASGYVRSSYSYNPRLIDPGNNNLRRFERTPQFEPQKLLAVDYFDSTPAGFAHLRERGWNLLLTDGSVKFSTSDTAYRIITAAAISDSGIPIQSIGPILDALEIDR